MIIVYPPTVNYYKLITTPQPLLTAMAERGHTVYFGQIDNKTEPIRQAQNNLYVYGDIKQVKERLSGDNVVLYLNHPAHFQEYCPMFPQAFKIYHNLDVYESTEQQDKNAFSRGSYDLVLAQSPFCKRILEQRGAKDVQILRNACHFETISSAKPDERWLECYKKLAIYKENRPILGFFGALGRWIDYRLLREINNSPNYNLVLFGFLYDFPEREVEGFYFGGNLTEEEYSSRMKCCDALLLPNRSGLNMQLYQQGQIPNKLFYYCATGKPIFQIGFPSVASQFGYLTINATDPEEFIGNLYHRVYRPFMANDLYDPAGATLRIEFARSNSWKIRTRQLEDIVEKGLKKWQKRQPQ